MVSSTASPAAHARGLPPKVVPCWPAVSIAVTSEPKVTRAPIGTPPPRPLARVIASGTMPDGLVGEPVTGATDAGLDLVDDEQRAVGARHLPGQAQVVGDSSRTPASPWIGSTKRAAVESSTAARRASASFGGTKTTSGMSGSKGSR